MNRRKFLIGAGSIAAGSAAAMGTGAFTNASVERSVNVNVVSDENAYVGLDPSVGANSNFAEINDNQIDISLDGDGVDGSGINEDSNYGFLELFAVRNQGTQPAFFFVDPTTVTIDGKSIYNDKANDYIDPQATGLPDQGDFGGSLTGVYNPGTGGTSSIDIDGSKDRMVYPPSKIAEAFDVIFDSFTDDGESGRDLFTVAPGKKFYFGLVVEEKGDNAFGDVSMDLRASSSAVSQ